MSQKVKLSDLKPDTKNSNKGTARGLKMIEASLQQDGFGRSILVDKFGNVVAGNKTLESVANTFGVDTEVIVVKTNGNQVVAVQREDLDLTDPDPNSKARRLAYRDNLAHEFSFELDPAQVMADIEAGFDFEAIDISLPDLGELLGKAAGEMLAGGDAGADTEAQVDRAEELRRQWGVEPGQLWRLGDHRLICGDCTDAAVVERVMGGERAEMMFTDPPYGVDYTGGHFHSGDVNIKRERPKLENDGDTGIYAKFLPIVLPHVDGPCYVWFASSVGKPVYDAIIGNGCEIHAMIIWNKVNATYAAMNAQYKQRHEPCMYFKPKKSTLRWVGPSDERTVWDEKRDGVNEYHPTQKPIVLPERALKNHAVTVVIDPFSGSGTTIIACENLQRRCRAIEIDPGYVAVALERFYQHSGILPELIYTPTHKAIAVVKNIQ